LLIFSIQETHVEDSIHNMRWKLGWIKEYRN